MGLVFLLAFTASGAASHIRGVGPIAISAEIRPEAGCSNPPWDQAVHEELETDNALAVHPDGGHRMVAMWSQGFFIEMPMAVSDDGGQTWTQRPSPFRNWPCPSTAEETVFFLGNANPSLSFAEDRLYAAYAAGPNVSAAVSLDGGETWSDPVRVENKSGELHEPVIVAHPTHPGKAYIAYTWQLSDDPTVTHPINGHFAKTEDGGLTWSEPVTMYAAPQGIRSTMHEVTILNGTLVDTFDESDDLQHYVSGQPRLRRATVSHDDGATWSDPVTVASSSPYRAVDPEVPAIAMGWPFTDSAANGKKVVLTWQDHEHTRQALKPVPSWGAIRIGVSNNGVDWTVRDVAYSASQKFEPNVGVHRDGTIGVLYYDLLNDRLGDAELTTTVVFAQSRDDGLTWTYRELQRFDLRRMPLDPYNQAYAIVDYNSVVPVHKGFALTFMGGAEGADGPSDIYFARVTT